VAIATETHTRDLANEDWAGEPSARFARSPHSVRASGRGELRERPANDGM
jgi:hypothetical protein